MDLKKMFEVCVDRETTIKETMQRINNSGMGIGLVLDVQNKLIATVTDGDIRRAILRGVSLEEEITKIANDNPIYISKYASKEVIQDIFIKKSIRHLPVLDENGVLLDIIKINDLMFSSRKENPVVIMAGGLGTRLGDLTKDTPKPMLKIGEEPILYHIIKNFKKYGFNKILISVNYKSEVIENYFQDGEAYGIKIDYIREKKRLGTAGGIKLAGELIDKPFFVINGDIFTNLNVENMMNFHIENKFDITIGTRKYIHQIPYGIVEYEGINIKTLKEKPKLEFLVNGGVYCLNPELIKYIPKDTYFEITDLISVCLEKGFKIGNYKIEEYWMDIGRVEDYKKVNEDIKYI